MVDVNLICQLCNKTYWHKNIPVAFPCGEDFWSDCNTALELTRDKRKNYAKCPFCNEKFNPYSTVPVKSKLEYMLNSQVYCEFHSNQQATYICSEHKFVLWSACASDHKCSSMISIANRSTLDFLQEIDPRNQLEGKWLQEKLSSMRRQRGAINFEGGAEMQLNRFAEYLPRVANSNRTWKFSKFGNQAEAVTVVVSKTIMLTGFDFGAPFKEDGVIHLNYMAITEGNRTWSKQLHYDCEKMDFTNPGEGIKSVKIMLNKFFTMKAGEMYTIKLRMQGDGVYNGFRLAEVFTEGQDGTNFEFGVPFYEGDDYKCGENAAEGPILKFYYREAF